MKQFVSNKQEVDMYINDYKYTSPLLNLGSLVVYMVLLPIMHIMVGCGGRCFKRNKVWRFWRRKISYKAYLNFYTTFQIVFIISACIFMWMNKTYWGGHVSATRILTLEFYVSLFSLMASFLLLTGLCMTKQYTKWWSLDVAIK